MEKKLASRFMLVYAIAIVGQIAWVSLAVIYHWPAGLWLMPIGLGIVYWVTSERVIMRMRGIKIVEPDNDYRGILNMVNRLCARAELPRPRIAILTSDVPTAFTINNGSSSSIIITSGTLRILTDRELEGVLAHELSHVKNSDVALMVWVSLIVYVRVLFVGWISRYRELLADEQASIMTGHPRDLAIALLKFAESPMDLNDLGEVSRIKAALIHSDGRTGSIFDRMTATHPSTEERVRRLMALEARMNQFQKET